MAAPENDQLLNIPDFVTQKILFSLVSVADLVLTCFNSAVCSFWFAVIKSDPMKHSEVCFHHFCPKIRIIHLLYLLHIHHFNFVISAFLFLKQNILFVTK